MISRAKKKHDADRQTHIACVNGPMHGRVIKMPAGKWTIFHEYRGHGKKHRRHLYIFGLRVLAGEEWLYLKYQGVEK